MPTAADLNTPYIDFARYRAATADLLTKSVLMTSDLERRLAVNFEAVCRMQWHSIREPNTLACSAWHHNTACYSSNSDSLTFAVSVPCLRTNM